LPRVGVGPVAEGLRNAIAPISPGMLATATLDKRPARRLPVLAEALPERRRRNP
jgi:hypothetical protein